MTSNIQRKSSPHEIAAAAVVIRNPSARPHQWWVTVFGHRIGPYDAEGIANCDAADLRRQLAELLENEREGRA